MSSYKEPFLLLMWFGICRDSYGDAAGFPLQTLECVSSDCGARSNMDTPITVASASQVKTPLLIAVLHAVSNLGRDLQMCERGVRVEASHSTTNQFWCYQEEEIAAFPFVSSLIVSAFRLFSSLVYLFLLLCNKSLRHEELVSVFAVVALDAFEHRSTCQHSVPWCYQPWGTLSFLSCGLASCSFGSSSFLTEGGKGDFLLRWRREQSRCIAESGLIFLRLQVFYCF